MGHFFAKKLKTGSSAVWNHFGRCESKEKQCLTQRLMGQRNAANLLKKATGLIPENWNHVINSEQKHFRSVVSNSFSAAGRIYIRGFYTGQNRLKNNLSRQDYISGRQNLIKRSPKVMACSKKERSSPLSS